MNININCKQNDSGAWCKDKRIKRSLFGFGARCCLEYNQKTCPHKDPHPKPNLTPAPTS